MSSSGALHHALLTFREQLERRQQQRREERLAKTRATQNLPPPGTTPLPLSMDVKGLFDAVMASVSRDRDRYTQAGGFVTAAVAAAKPEGDAVDAPPPYAQVPVAPSSHMQAM